MQLTFDSDTDADNKKINMAVINSENINEKFSNDRLLDKFSQNECAEKSHEEVKKLDDAEKNSKDNIENSSDIEINKFCDSIKNDDTDETGLQDQTTGKKNEEESKDIVICQLDNQTFGTTDITTPCNEFDKKCVFEGESQITENVETESIETEILTKIISKKPVLEICNSNEKESVSTTDIENTSSLHSKDSLGCNNEGSATPLEISNISSQKMDVDKDHESNGDISKTSIEVGLLSQHCEHDIEELKPIVECHKYHKTIIDRKINLEKEYIDNTLLPHSAAVTSQNKLNDHVKHDVVTITNNVDSIVESSDVKLDKSSKEEEVLKSEITPPIAISKNHVDPNTIEINDDSSQDDISQNETSVTLSPTNEEKVEISNINELSNLNEKDEPVCNSNIDSSNANNETKIEEEKSVDSNVQNRSSIGENNEIQGSLKSELSNTLDILSDDDDSHVSKENNVLQENNKQCINVEDDDDDILLIDDEEVSSSCHLMSPNGEKSIPAKVVKEILENNQALAEKKLETPTYNVAEVAKDTHDTVEKAENITAESDTKKVKSEAEIPSSPLSKPLLPTNFFSMCKKNVADMTRIELEEFCIMKIVESVVDRGNLGEMKSQIKKMSMLMDEHRNKIKSITKQNQDLQVILRSVQESCRNNSLVTPLKITRSVGIQVVMADKSKQKTTAPHQNNVPTSSPAKPVRSPSLQNKLKQITTPSQNIPVPRLVPAKNLPSNIMQNQTPNNKVSTNLQPTPVRPAVPRPEKRSFSKSHTGSDTVDLTDDEPPNKVVTRPGNQTVRVISPQNLMPPQHRVQMVNSPRKVYIPISAGQVPNPQAYMPKPVNNQNVKQRGPGMKRHPAPLPESGKQYQAPSWKAIPPAPEIKLSKVENGIVISWKLDNYREDSHENIASYQIYAYQETSSPPNTTLWKKIGDVKALPLPMACTLTQFVPGFKYYFAVRAVDVRSRQGSFSNPGNIMLLNK